MASASTKTSLILAAAIFAGAASVGTEIDVSGQGQYILKDFTVSAVDNRLKTETIIFYTQGLSSSETMNANGHPSIDHYVLMDRNKLNGHEIRQAYSEGQVLAEMTKADMPYMKAGKSYSVEYTQPLSNILGYTNYSKKIVDFTPTK